MCFSFYETKFLGIFLASRFERGIAMYSAEDVLSAADVVFNLNCIACIPIHIPRMSIFLQCKGEEEESDMEDIDVHEVSTWIMSCLKRGSGARPSTAVHLFTL